MDRCTTGAPDGAAAPPITSGSSTCTHLPSLAHRIGRCRGRTVPDCLVRSRFGHGLHPVRCAARHRHDRRGRGGAAAPGAAAAPGRRAPGSKRRTSSRHRRCAQRAADRVHRWPGDQPRAGDPAPDRSAVPGRAGPLRPRVPACRLGQAEGAAPSRLPAHRARWHCWHLPRWTCSRPTATPCCTWPTRAFGLFVENGNASVQERRSTRTAGATRPLRGGQFLVRSTAAESTVREPPRAGLHRPHAARLSRYAARPRGAVS